MPHVRMLDHSRLFQWAVLALLWSLIYLSALSSPALLNDADSVHAEAAREMVAREDWVTLHINGLRYLEKAPLLYWLSALAITLFGPLEWAVRLPVALFGLFLTLLLYRFGSRFWGDRVGFFAALIYVTSLGPYAFSRVLLPDVMLTFFVTLAFYTYLQVLHQPQLAPEPLGCWQPRGMGLFVAGALAMLAKGLVGCIFIVGVIFVHRLLSGRWAAFKRWEILAGVGTGSNEGAEIVQLDA
ncbi:MAG: glycosyltransferase family 39 protein [Nitrospinae bacterium]|nr:glycosyltransferase family 39 protein [Nitrospinota bacterium]